MRSERLVIAGLVLLALATPLPGADAELAERVLAVVDESPILLSETEAFAALRGLARAPALEALVDERLMYREAMRLPEAGLRPEDEERALRGLLAGRPESFVARFGEAVFRRIARRQAAILKYVDFRFRPQLRVEDEAVRRALAARPEAVADEAALAAVRSELEGRALDEKIEAWVGELRAGAEVRYVRGVDERP
jgi:hypothetical protein